jgi:hypothetical protein
MSKPLFLNDKPYTIQVGTPSGAGRQIQPGQAVEGDYFFSSVRAGMPLRQLSPDEVTKFDKKKIVMSISLDGTVQVEAYTPHISLLPVPSGPVTEVTLPRPDAVNKTMEDTVNQAAKEMGTSIPTVPELNKMSLDQLNALAVRYNISDASSRSEIVKQLKAKLSL